MNYLRTAILLAGLTALFMGVGYLIGGQSGAVIALFVAAAMNLLSYWNADKLVLSMHGAREVDEHNAPDLVRLVHELASRAGLPMPRVYLMDNPQPNAFATGRNPEHAAVAVTTGLLEMLSREEVAGVIAHELAHVRNRDTLTMTVTATIAGAISMLAQFGLFFGGHRDNNNGGVGIIGTIAMVLLAASVSLRLFRFGGVQKIVLGGIGAGFVLYVMAKITGDLSKAGLMAPLGAAGLPPAVGAVTVLIALLYQEDG